MQGAALLVAVQRRRLGEAQRQVLVAAQPRPEQDHVARAVHGLQRHAPVRLGVRVHPEDVLLVVLQVPRGLVGLLVVEQGRLHLDVAAARVLAPAEVLEQVPDHHPLRVPERRAWRVLREVEELELRPEPPMVAPARLLEQREVRVEVGLRVERGAVDAGQLGVVLVAPPVRPGEAGQLERLDRLRVLQMRAAAEVGEVALTVAVVQRTAKRGCRPPACRRARPCTARPPRRSGPWPRRGRSPRGSNLVLRRSRASPRPRCAPDRPRGSARETRSRSRSRSRSAGRSRS